MKGGGGALSGGPVCGTFVLRVPLDQLAGWLPGCLAGVEILCGRLPDRLSSSSHQKDAPTNNMPPPLPPECSALVAKTLRFAHPFCLFPSLFPSFAYRPTQVRGVPLPKWHPGRQVRSHPRRGGGRQAATKQAKQAEEDQESQGKLVGLCFRCSSFGGSGCDWFAGAANQLVVTANPLQV